MRLGKLDIKNPYLLAPLAGVSDMPFRKICHRFGSGLSFTEMVSAKAIYYQNANVRPLLAIDPNEGPVIVQLFGSDPQLIHDMIQKIDQPSFLGFDINMGCPVPKIVNNNEGSHLMTNPNLVGQIIKEARKATDKSLSVKFRKGFDATQVNAPLIGQIAESEGADFVTVHGRTREQYYAGAADWDIIAQVKKAVNIPVVGNGDIYSAKDAQAMFDQTGCDAVMVARGAMGNPWIFSNLNQLNTNNPIDFRPEIKEVSDMIIEHAQNLIAFKGEYLALREMRKHTGWYIKGYKNAVLVRKQVNAIETIEDLVKVLEILMVD